MILKSKLTFHLVLAGVLAFHFGCQDRNLGILQKSDNADDRIQAALKLAAKKSRKAAEPLAGILRNAESSSGLKAAAAFALGEIGDPAAVDALSETLRTGLDSKAGCEAAKALGLIGDEKAIGVLFEAQGNDAIVFHPLDQLANLARLMNKPSLVKNREAVKAFNEAYEPFAREQIPSVRWEAARSLARIIGGETSDLVQIELMQRRKWEDLLMATIGGRQEFELLPPLIRLQIKRIFHASDLDAKELESEGLGIGTTEEIKADYEKGRRLRSVYRTYLVLLALGEQATEALILEAFSTPNSSRSLKPMALDLYASGHDPFKSAAASWAAAHGLRIEFRAQTNMRIGGTSVTAPVLLGGAKASLGEGLPIRWGELRDGHR